MTCYNCQKTGHLAKNCTAGKALIYTGKRVECYNCKKEGHIARECPQQEEPRNKEIECHNCHKTGHMARACPTGPSTGTGGERRRPIECHNCHETGHIARACPSSKNLFTQTRRSDIANLSCMQNAEKYIVYNMSC